MLTVRQFHTILGMAWDAEFSSLVEIRFHEQEDGKSERITAFCGPYSAEIKLNIPLQTAHLPSVIAFKLSDMRQLFHKFRRGYRDLDCILPLQLTDEKLKVLRGPGRESEISVIKK